MTEVGKLKIATVQNCLVVFGVEKNLLPITNFVSVIIIYISISNECIQYTCSCAAQNVEANMV